jgi:hypothetical protein
MCLNQLPETVQARLSSSDLTRLLFLLLLLQLVRPLQDDCPPPGECRSPRQNAAGHGQQHAVAAPDRAATAC